MSLTPLKLRPGINRSTTDYGNEGGWYDCDKVRFRNGAPEKIGGWVKYITSPFVGVARSLFNWVTLDSRNLLAVGTNLKYYLESSGGLYDITPLRATVTLGADPFAATSGSPVVTVTHAVHGAATGDYVTFSAAATFAGIPAASLNAEHAVTVLSANTYTIKLAANATATAAGGGAAVSAAYQISTGASVSVPGFGWNAGSWGRGTWNSAATVSQAAFSTLRLWSQESFGEDHVFCVHGGAIYYWKKSTGLSSRATALTAIAGASNVPLMATKLVMSTADRHLIALGTNAIGSTTQDPLLIRWCDTENLANWTPAVTNAAGDLRVASGNHIVTAVKLKNEIVVLTDASVVGLQYIGAPDIFGLNPIAENISIVGPQAAISSGNVVFWMGRDKFYSYDGRVEPLHCPLDTYIFANFNHTQERQVHAGTCETFNEVWWFYCSSASTEIDRYVIYNYLEKTWYHGSLARSVWLDSPIKPYPIAASGGYLYYHENGVDADRTQAITAFVESSDIDIAEGEEFMFVTRVIPDIAFTGSVASAPAVTMTLTPKNTPGGAARAGVAATVSRTVAMEVGRHTEICDVRLRGRQVKLRLESTGLGVKWRLGVPRVDARTDGRK